MYSLIPVVTAVICKIACDRFGGLTKNNW